MDYPSYRSPFSSAFNGVQMGTGYPAWICTPDEVAALLRARTKNSHGEELGTWTEDTRPTREEVEKIIWMVSGDMVLCVGPWLPNYLWTKATFVIALKAAMMVELSYWPEQIETEQSPYQRYADLLAAEVTALCDAASGFRPDGYPSPDPDQDTNVPLYYFGDGINPCAAPRYEYDPMTQRYLVWGEFPSWMTGYYELPLSYTRDA